MKKHNYRIDINGTVKEEKGKRFEYSFGHTKNIVLLINGNKVSIIFSIYPKYDFDSIDEKKIFKDCIKKALLTGVLLNGKELIINKLFCTIDDQKEQIGAPTVYSMLNGGNINNIIQLKERECILDKLLSMPLSKEDNKLACVISLLISESKEYLQEKFMYLWMSFNSFYNEKCKIDNYEKRKEWKRISHLINYYGYGDEILEEGNQIIESMYHVINNWDNTPISEFSINEKLKNNIEELLKNNNYEGKLSAYGYLLGDFSYRLRCKYFHGNKASNIYCFGDEFNLNAIKISIESLKSFLYDHIVDVFNGS